MNKKDPNKKWIQCESTFRQGGGFVFCGKEKGHDGDHRGPSAQWNDKGRVPISEKLP